MKKYFLLFLSFVFSISGYAVQTDNGTGVTQSGSTWYSTIVYGNYDIQDGNNLDVNFSYPSNHVKFDCYRASITGGDDKKKIEVQHKVDNSWSVFYTYLLSDKNKWYTTESGSLNPNATAIAFRRVAGTSERRVKNIYVKMAPHTKMNTSSISFVNVPVGTTQTQTIDFYSFLSGGSGIQAYVIDDSNNKKDVPGLSLSKNNIGANLCEKIGENNYSITVTFTPQSIISLTGYKVRIVNSGAVIGSTIDIPISTLSSALSSPTNLTCTANAYDYVSLSWNKVGGATSYKIYDNGSFVKSVGTTSTNITGLAMGSNHKYTVTSVYASSESNHSNAVNVTTNSYPKTSSVWFSNVGQNSFTINWNKVNLLANHNFVRYQVHIYYHDYYDVRCERPTWVRTEYISNQNQTSLTINNVDDATRFVVYVGVDFNYSLDGNTTSYDVSFYTKGGEYAGWVRASVETNTTYNSSAEISNGIYIYKGEWHYININIANEIYGDVFSLPKSWAFYYPPENLKYCGWVEAEGNATHYIEDDATGYKYALTGKNNGYTTYTINNKFQTYVYSINQTLDQVVFKGSRPGGAQKIYVGDAYSKIARHILMENETINLGNVKIGDNINVPIRFKSFLVDNALTAASDNSDFKPNKTTICGKAPTKAGTFCQTGDRSYDFTVNFTPSKEGEAIAHIVVSDGIRSKTVTITANVYRRNTFFIEGEWRENEKWSCGLPAENEDVIIAANVTIPDGVVIKAGNVELNSNTSITIKPQGALKINTISKANNADIIIEANELNTGSFLYKNTNKVNATVQLYSKASSEGLNYGVAGSFYDPKWQYIGIIAESIKYSDLNTDGVTNWMYKWDETQNAVSCWSEKMNQNSYLYAWKGYCIAQESALTYTYDGVLLNGDHTYELTYTKSASSKDDLGNNLITNSYSGPIDIASLSDANFHNAEATIYIYNTGSYAEWREQSNNTLGFNPGQTIAIPVNSISELGSEYPHTIPSSQAFFVAAKDGGGQFVVNYERNVYNPTSLNNQKRVVSEENNRFNVLKIIVKSSTSNDRLYLLEHENCTPNFDNGYDAIKIFDNNGPQIYAINDSMNTSVNTDSTMINQYIGFIGDSESEEYTLTFDVDKLHSYNKLYLYDLITNQSVDILNNETYTFYYIPTDNEPRFLITGEKKEEDTTTAIETINSLGEINLNDIVYIYNANGHLIYNSKIHSVNNFDYLTNGIYIIVTSNKTFKLCLLK